MGAVEPTITRRKRAMSAVPPELPRASADPTEHTTEQSGPESQAGSAGTDFGANEWLVDEMYQRYLADPSSVAMEWWNFFADYKPPSGSPAQPVTAAGQPAGPAPAPAGPAPTPPAPAPAAPAPAAPAPAAPGSAAPAATVPGNAAPPQAPAPAPAAPAAPASPAAAPVRPAQPAQDGKPAGEPAAAAHDSTVTRLRGAAARTADNMAASLSVPTATSVRAIPAKLLADNRIVINNNLARGRGGKVSFTHLIGFAMVQALRTMPAM